MARGRVALHALPRPSAVGRSSRSQGRSRVTAISLKLKQSAAAEAGSQRRPAVMRHDEAADGWRVPTRHRPTTAAQPRGPTGPLSGWSSFGAPCATPLCVRRVVAAGTAAPQSVCSSSANYLSNRSTMLHGSQLPARSLSCTQSSSPSSSSCRSSPCCAATDERATTY
jgi:hypothetical protein